MMSPDAYFTWIALILTGLIFIALVLGFLYLVYGKEEETEETQFSLALVFVTQETRLNKRTVKAVDNKITRKQVTQCLSLQAKENRYYEFSVQKESK